MQGEKNHSPHTGHQRANTTNTPSQKKAHKTISKLFNRTDHKGQHTLVTRPAQAKPTEESQEHKNHWRYCQFKLKSMYNAKVGNTEATALLDSGTTLGCISKQFYNRIHHLKPSIVIDTNAGPAIMITSASADELINLGRCRLHIKLGPKTFEYYFQIIKNLK